MEEQAKEHRRRFDQEFKCNAVRLVIDGGRKATEVARDLGIDVNSLYHWKRQMLDDGDQAFPGKGKLKPDDEELRKLKKQLRDVTEERDILKKALAFFSRSEQ